MSEIINAEQQSISNLEQQSISNSEQQSTPETDSFDQKIGRKRIGNLTSSGTFKLIVAGMTGGICNTGILVIDQASSPTVSETFDPIPGLDMGLFQELGFHLICSMFVGGILAPAVAVLTVGPSTRNMKRLIAMTIVFATFLPSTISTAKRAIQAEQVEQQVVKAEQEAEQAKKQVELKQEEIENTKQNALENLRDIDVTTQIGDSKTVVNKNTFQNKLNGIINLGDSAESKATLDKVIKSLQELQNELKLINGIGSSTENITLGEKELLLNQIDSHIQLFQGKLNKLSSSNGAGIENRNETESNPAN